MKLNIDCVRDILLAVESKDFGHQLTLDSLHTQIPQYTLDEVEYACLKLDEANMLDVTYINTIGRTTPAVARINELTYQGHEFLNDIRAEDNWQKLSSALKQGGSASLKAIANVALELGTSALKSKLGL